MAAGHKRVGFRDLAGGVLTMMPETATVTRSLFNLITLKPHSQRSIGVIIEHWAAKTPNNIALRFEDQQWTYAEFNAWVNQIAAVYVANGIQQGDAIAILMHNQPEALACVAAAVKLGAVAGLLNHNQQGDVLKHSVNLTKPKLVVCSDECYAQMEETGITPSNTDDIGFMWVGAQAQTASSAAPTGWHDLTALAKNESTDNHAVTQTIIAKTPCFYIFTSGTTGLPKASVMTHYRWMSSMAGMGGATMRLHKSDVFYVCLPLYHNNGLTVSWSAVLSGGATMALDRKFSASQFWDRIRFYDATAFCYIGELLRYLINMPAQNNDQDHKVKKIVGNGLRPEIWQDFVKRFNIRRIAEFYGASEGNIAFINAFGTSETAGFSPMPFAVVNFDNEEEEAIRDSNTGFMTRVAKGESGLLITEVSDKRPFDGYTDKSESEKKLLRDVFKKGDIWFNTGDLVRDQGFKHIQFVDRVGDTFRWKGENVSTGEVEGVFTHVANVEQAVVYGVDVPNCDGKAGMAAVTLAPGTAFDAAAVAAHLTAELPIYAVPVFIRIRPEATTTGTFKYRKVELKQEGFDQSKMDDALYVLIDNTYQPLDADLAAKIDAGSIRL